MHFCINVENECCVPSIDRPVEFEYMHSKKSKNWSHLQFNAIEWLQS